MYDNIYLLSRLNWKGKIKKKEISFFGKSLSFILNCLFALSVLSYLVYYGFTNFNDITMDTFFISLMNSSYLKYNLIAIILLGTLVKINWRKKYDVAINTTDDNVVRIIFNAGRLVGMEYRIFMEDISNICLYKDGSFSFYCANIEIDNYENIDYTKGIIKIKGGDSGVFIEDLQDYLGKRVQYKNRKN